MIQIKKELDAGKVLNEACKECQKELKNEKEQTEKEFLDEYKKNIHKYEKPSVAVDILIYTIGEIESENYRKLEKKELKVLMIKRKDHPFMGCWAIPGGFMQMNESLEEAAERELYEETGLNGIYMEQLYTYGDVKRDPRYRIISSAYMALVDTAFELKAGDDADDARWFTVKTIPVESKKIYKENGYILEKIVELKLTCEDIVLSGKVLYTKTVEGRRIRREMKMIERKGIAFDHAQIIQYGLDRLKNKIEYTDIVFNLLEEKFTLADLRQVYEIILDKEIKQASINRKFKPMVAETNKVRRGKGHKPAQLFRFNPAWNDE